MEMKSTMMHFALRASKAINAVLTIEREDTADSAVPNANGTIIATYSKGNDTVITVNFRCHCK